VAKQKVKLQYIRQKRQVAVYMLGQWFSTFLLLLPNFSVERNLRPT